jgi:hypothetical protein
MQQVFGMFDSELVRDENATCDEQGRYMLINMQPGAETKIEQITPSCFIFHVDDCEVLEVTERFMFEGIYKLNTQIEYYEALKGL